MFANKRGNATYGIAAFAALGLTFSLAPASDVAAAPTGLAVSPTVELGSVMKGGREGRQPTYRVSSQSTGNPNIVLHQLTNPAAKTDRVVEQIWTGTYAVVNTNGSVTTGGGGVTLEDACSVPGMATSLNLSDALDASGNREFSCEGGEPVLGSEVGAKSLGNVWIMSSRSKKNKGARLEAAWTRRHLMQDKARKHAWVVDKTWGSGWGRSGKGILNSWRSKLQHQRNGNTPRPNFYAVRPLGRKVHQSGDCSVVGWSFEIPRTGIGVSGGSQVCDKSVMYDLLNKSNGKRWSGARIHAGKGSINRTERLGISTGTGVTSRVKRGGGGCDDKQCRPVPLRSECAEGKPGRKDKLPSFCARWFATMFAKRVG